MTCTHLACGFMSTIDEAEDRGTHKDGRDVFILFTNVHLSSRMNALHHCFQNISPCDFKHCRLVFQLLRILSCISIFTDSNAFLQALHLTDPDPLILSLSSSLSSQQQHHPLSNWFQCMLASRPVTCRSPDQRRQPADHTTYRQNNKQIWKRLSQSEWQIPDSTEPYSAA